MTEQLVARLGQQPAGGIVRVHVAVLPVEGDETLVDLLEQGPRASLAMSELAAGALLAEAAVQGRGLAARGGTTGHAHLEAAVEAQLE